MGVRFRGPEPTLSVDNVFPVFDYVQQMFLKQNPNCLSILALLRGLNEESKLNLQRYIDHPFRKREVSIVYRWDRSQICELVFPFLQFLHPYLQNLSLLTI